MLKFEKKKSVAKRLNKITVIKFMRISCTEGTNDYRNLMVTTERKRSEEWEVRLHGRRRGRWEENIKGVILYTQHVILWT